MKKSCPKYCGFTSHNFITLREHIKKEHPELIVPNIIEEEE